MALKLLLLWIAGLLTGLLFSPWVGWVVASVAFFARMVTKYKFLSYLLLVVAFGILASESFYTSDGQENELQVEQPTQTRVLRACVERLHSAGLEPETEQLAVGILFGQKAEMDKGMKTSFREAGMSHILAVSGLHIGIIWALLFLLFRPLILLSILTNLNEVKVGYVLRIVVLAVLWAYIVMIGSPPSALRAGLMISLTQVSAVCGRDAWGWHNLWLAAFIILVCQPTLLFDVGFQLSVMATAGILAFLPLMVEKRRHSRKLLPAEKRYSTIKKIGRWCASMFWLSVSAQIFTVPICAYYFHQVPLLGWLQGLLAVPLVPVFVYMAVAVLLCPMLWTLPLEVVSWWLRQVARLIVGLEDVLTGGEMYWYPTLLETLLLEAALMGLLFILKRLEAESRAIWV